MLKTFHSSRHRSKHETLRTRVWEFHDDHPLPRPLNKLARGALYWVRRSRHATRQTARELDPVPRQQFLRAEPFPSMSFDAAKQWFHSVHQANEVVYQGDGSWKPHPFAFYAGMGAPVEEMALRVPGYLAAYDATGHAPYRDRAESAGVQLLRARVLPDGHVLLQGHTSIDFTYPLVGAALLELWTRDSTRGAYLDAARKIGDRLVDYHIAGSYNHAVMPCRLLAQLYRHTGERTYLDAAVRRAFRAGVAFQLPAGHWPGYNVWPWYQGVILRGLIETYAAMPFTVDLVAKKDRLAESITTGLNRLIVAQRADGSLKPDRGKWKGLVKWQDDVVVFDGACFRRRPLASGYPGHGAYIVGAILAAHRLLGVEAMLPVLHGYASFLAGTGRLWRLEFCTAAAGQYLSLVHELAQQFPSAQPSPSEAEAGGESAPVSTRPAPRPRRRST